MSGRRAEGSTYDIPYEVEEGRKGSVGIMPLHQTCEISDEEIQYKSNEM